MCCPYNNAEIIALEDTPYLRGSIPWRRLALLDNVNSLFLLCTQIPLKLYKNFRARSPAIRSAQTRFLRDQIQHLIGADDAVARTRAAVAVPTTRHAAGLARPHLADDPLDFRPRHSMSHAYVAKYVLDGLGGHSSSRSTPRAAAAAAAAIIDCRGGVDYVLLKSPWEFLRVAMTILRGRGGWG